MMRRDIRRSVLISLTAPVFTLLLGPCALAGGQPVSNMPRESRWNSAHPRPFFTSQKVAQLRERIEQDERFRQAWLRIKEPADRHLKEQLVSKEYGFQGRAIFIPRRNWSALFLSPLWSGTIVANSRRAVFTPATSS
jgi:hypothetical protein